MLSRGDFGAIMHIDIHPPLYVTSNVRVVQGCLHGLLGEIVHDNGNEA
jgi:hypothetical protein